MAERICFGVDVAILTVYDVAECEFLVLGQIRRVQVFLMLMRNDLF